MRNPLGTALDRGASTRGLAGLVGGALVAPLLLTAIVAVWLGGSHAEWNVLIGLGISGILVVGYQIFVGNTGIVSFGHVAFMGLGAYAAGLTTIPVALRTFELPGLPLGLAHVSVGLIPSVLVGGAVAAGFAALVGPVLLRLSGGAAAVVTLSLLEIMNVVFQNATSLTRGTQTLFAVPQDIGVATVYGMLCAVVVAAVVVKFSSAGLRARAVRDEPLAAETAGVGVIGARMVPWVVSAAVTGMGGALWAHQVTAFSADSFFVAQGIPVIVMAILGGVGSVSGAVTGAVLLTAWLELMRHVEAGSVLGVHVPGLVGISQFSVGLGLIVLLRLRPQGLLGASELQLRQPSGK